MKTFILCILIVSSAAVAAQSVSITSDGTAPDASAMLDIKSTTSGLLVPRMTTAERTAIGSPATGLMVYDTDVNTFWCYAGASWVEIVQGYVALLQDADDDTKIEVEQSPDEDLIRFSMAGTEHFRMEDSARFAVLNSGGSVFMGSGAGAVDDLTANGNVFIGEESGVSNTVGNRNTFIGYQAGRSTVGTASGNDVPGTKNSYIGYQSGLDNVAGFDNTFIGFTSGQSNDAERNVFIGAYTGRNNTTGFRNTYIGTAAGEHSGAGNKNIGIGMWAGRFNDGNSNVMVGNNAGNGASADSSVMVGMGAGGASGGVGNVLIGFQAGFGAVGGNKLYIENSTSSNPLIYGEFDNDIVRINGQLEVTQGFVDADGDTKIQVEESADEDIIRFDLAGQERWVMQENRLAPINTGLSVFIGQGAGLNDDFTNNGNVGIGDLALNANTWGHSNTATGYQALGSNITGTSNTAIGYNADVNFGNLSNATAIGANAFVHTSNSLVLGNNANVGIGTSSPEDRLDVRNSSGYPAIRVNSGEGDTSSVKLLEGTGFGFELQYDGTGDQLHLWSRRFAGNEDIRMTWEKNGRVGIGTSAPLALLDIRGGDVLISRNPLETLALTRFLLIGGARNGSGSPYAQIRFSNLDNNGNNAQYIGAQIESHNASGSDDGDLRFYTYNGSLGLRMIIEDGGDVGIGVSNSNEILEIGGDGRMFIGDGGGANRRGLLIDAIENGDYVRLNPYDYGTSTDMDLHIVANVYATGGDFYTSASNGVINAGGGIMNASINMIADNVVVPLNVNGDEDLYIGDDLELGSQGYKPGGGSWAAASDVRLKRDITLFSDGLAELLQIEPVRYRYNDLISFYDNDKEYIGIIAQDLERIAPYMVELSPFGQRVEEDANGNEIIVEQGSNYYTVDPSAFTYMLINAVKEQQTILEAQQAQIDELREMIVKTQN